MCICVSLWYNMCMDWYCVFVCCVISWCVVYQRDVVVHGVTWCVVMWYGVPDMSVSSDVVSRCVVSCHDMMRRGVTTMRYYLS